MHLLICTACACFHSAIVSSFNRNPTGPAKPQTFTIWPRPVTVCQRWPKAVSHNLFSNGGLYLLKPDISHAREELHLKLQLLFIETEHLIFICKERDDYQFSSQYTEHSFLRHLKICAQKGRWLSCLQVLCWVSLRGGSEVENFEGKTVITECKKGPGAQIWTSMWGAPSVQQ